MNNVILVADKNGNPIGGIRANSKQQMRTNARSMLAERLSLGAYGTSFQGKRDFYQILGYNPEPTVEDFRTRFERDPVAGTVVEYPCVETWRDTPTVKDGKDKDAKDDTEFCNAWSDFAERMRVYSYCQRVDTLAGIGRFGLLHIGVAGSSDLATEVSSVRRPEDIIYLQSYSEKSVEVAEWQTDPTNPRYGLPHIYKLNVSHMEGAAQNAFGSKDLLVHWSRCIHVAEGLLENEVYGRPRLQRVINLLDDIMKVVGGSAEATWLLMRKGFVLDIDPEMDDLTADAATALEEQFDEYDHGIRRFIKTRGLKVNDLGSEVVDPSGIFDIILTLISIATRIPKRILQGSERGELASSQDAATWAGFIASRQLNYAEPIILRPLIDRLIKWGAIPKPAAGRYSCAWDALFEKSDDEKAKEALAWADAIQKVTAALGHPVVTAEEFRGEFTPFPGKLPKELKDAQAKALAPKQPVPPQLQQPVVPVDGQPPSVPVPAVNSEDVLEQVERIMANMGYGAREARAMRDAVGRLRTRAE